MGEIKERTEEQTLSFKAKGSSGGSDWDDGVYCHIKTLEIQFGGRCIDAIRFEYEGKDGNTITPQKHGGNEGKQIIQICLNCPSEYLISVHGYHGNIYDRIGNPTNVIRSLSFETNERSLGPFGIEEGIKFSFPTTGLIKIVGFHGRSGWFLDAIGFHFLPISFSK